MEELGHGSAELGLRCAPAWHGRMATTIDTHRMLQVQACATHQMGWGMAQQVASHMGYLHPRDGAVDGSHHRHPQDAGGACLCHSPDGLGQGSAELWLRCAPARHGRMATTIDTHRMLKVHACATHQMAVGVYGGCHPAMPGWCTPHPQPQFS